VRPPCWADPCSRLALTVVPGVARRRAAALADGGGRYAAPALLRAVPASVPEPDSVGRGPLERDGAVGDAEVAARCAGAGAPAARPPATTAADVDASVDLSPRCSTAVERARAPR
jgi:hypothetical protein